MRHFSKIFLLLYLISFCCNPTTAQDKEKQPIKVDMNIKGVAIAGINLSQVDGDEVYGFNKVGACVGVGAIFPLGHRFSFSIEVLYDEKGSYRKYPPSPVDSLQLPYYSLKWNYLTAPVMIHFEDRNTWTIGVGFSWGRMVTFKEKEWNIVKEWNRPEITYKTKNDFAVIADLRFRIWKHLKFNIRYSYSLAKVRTRYYDPNPGIVEPWSRKQYNTAITLRLLYYFNEKYLPDRYTFKKKPKQRKSKNKTE